MTTDDFAFREYTEEKAEVARQDALWREADDIEAAARALVKSWDENPCPTCGGTGVAWDWLEAVALREALG